MRRPRPHLTPVLGGIALLLAPHALSATRDAASPSAPWTVTTGTQPRESGEDTGGASPGAAGTGSAEGERPPAGREYRVRDDNIYLTLGGYLVTFQTQAGASFGRLLGTNIDLENDLGVDSRSNTVRLDGHWRFKPRHALTFSWFALNRSGTSIIDETIEFEDVTFQVGAEVSSRFNTDWFGLGYRYSLIRSVRGEAGIGAGVSTYNFDLGLAGLASVDDGTGTPETRPVDVEDGIVAPVPVFGFFLGYGITPRLYFHGDVALFKASISDWDVRLLDSRLTFDYFFSRHVGLGFGINGTDIDVARFGDDPFSVTYRQSGLLVYLSLGF